MTTHPSGCGCRSCDADRAAARERARIRRLIGPALRELRDAISGQDASGTCHQTRRLYGYAETIDAATRPEAKRKKAKGTK